MEDYDYDSFLPDALFREDGEVDEEMLMQLLETNPEFAAQFQDYMAGYTDEMQQIHSQTFTDVWNHCILPSLISIWDLLLVLFAACILCNLIGRFIERSPNITHTAIFLLGLAVMWYFFKINSIILLVYIIACLYTLLYDKYILHRGVVLSVFSIVYAVLCEFSVEPEVWHSVRGAQMLLSMKAISLGFDIDKQDVSDLSSLEYISYMTNPGSVIFGPWTSFLYYINGLTTRKRWYDLRLIQYVTISAVISIVTLLYSSCILTWLITNDSYKWIIAYRDAQSFRFSHYFVSFTSQTTALLSGLSEYHPSGYMRKYVTVSQPLNIEIPRSLVEVVTSWNLPMHAWLKKYVFKTSRPIYGTFAAILLTYLASALLHGLNFQLAAVLLSLGFYSYIEYSIRKLLAGAFDSCIEARNCQDCSHAYKSTHPFTLFINLVFLALAVFHLAYLGVMFDTSDQQAQQEGYSMKHTLRKWSELGYLSHIVALSMYGFYWLVKPKPVRVHTD